MKRLEVSGEVRPLYWSLGVKGLIICQNYCLARTKIYSPIQLYFWSGIQYLEHEET